MKQLIYVFTALVLGLITLESFNASRLGKKDGAAPGYTGSPGDSLKNCTACHGGNAFTVDNWISSNIPEEGYVPNKTYTIKAINREHGATRFGFEISPQNNEGALLGKMILTDTFRTKFVGDEKYITYTENGIEGVDSFIWTFDWTAPAAGTGDVVFYGGFNSNYNGDKGGDKTFLSTLKVKEKTNSINSISNPNAISIFPNPVINELNLKVNGLNSGDYLIKVIDIKGRTIYSKEIQFNANKNLEPIKAMNWVKGQYTLVVENEERRIVKKFIKL